MGSLAFATELAPGSQACPGEVLGLGCDVEDYGSEEAFDTAEAGGGEDGAPPGTGGRRGYSFVGWGR